MNDDMHTQLAAAIQRYLRILANHGFILDAEGGPLIQGPVHGAYVLLIDAIQTIDPGFPRVDKLRSTLDDPEAELDRLEDQLVEFSAVLEAICDNYETSTGVDPIQARRDPATCDPMASLIVSALLAIDAAIERLRAMAATSGSGPASTARRILADLEAEDTGSAIERHLATRLATRQSR